MKTIISLVTFLIIYISCFSQDTLFMRKGDLVIGKVTEIRPDEIKYKDWDNLNGPVNVILKYSVESIHYENGKVENLNAPGVAPDYVNTTKAKISLDNPMYKRGFKDAKDNYVGYKAAGTTTLLISILYPPLGLIPAISCATTPPKDKTLNFPNEQYIKNPNYYEGYKKGAHKIKAGKVWKNFGIGCGIFLGWALLYSTQY
jgi:hypothetical protein